MTGEIFKAWCAAWLDTEGYVGLQTQMGQSARSIRVEISQKDPRPLKMIQDVYGGYLYDKGDIYRFILPPTKAYKFLKDVLPYLVVKRDKVEKLILIWETWKPKPMGRPKRT